MPAPASTDALRRRLRFDTPFWAGGVKYENGKWVYPGTRDFQGCVKILNKQRKLVPCIAHPWQLEFDQLLERQRAAGRPMRAIILKARKLGFCLEPSTRVLTADLRWLTLDEIRVGESIVATDDGKPAGCGNTRKLRVGVVEAKREVSEPAFRLRFDDGRSVVATGAHRWLCRRRGGTDADWRTVADMQLGDYVRHVTTPWEPGDLQDGWMGGFIDGEGCLAKKAAGGGELAISQRPGESLDHARDYLRSRGYAFREEVDRREARTNGRHQDNAKLLVSRTNELFRLIGQSRSVRFTADTSWWADRSLPGKRSGVAWAKVVAIEALGSRRMIDLQTDRKTFIAEGFVSHNSTWVAVKFLQRLTQIEYQAAIVTAQDTNTAGVIFDMAKLAHAHLPTMNELGLGFNIKPAIVASNFSANGRKFMQFGEPSRKLRMEGRTGESVLEIDTAGSPEAGRGYTPSMLHLSEVARWTGQLATRKMLSQLNAVPYEPETIVILESTANGLNHFHRRWVNARDGANDPDTGETYAALFVPWWRDPHCSLQFATGDDRKRFVETIGDERQFGEIVTDEPMLIERYELTAEQLYWRRMMIRTQHENNVELFKQENPASDDEAFIGSGRTVFSGILVSKAIHAAEAAPKPVRGSLRAEAWEDRRSRAGTIRVPLSAVWVPEREMAPAEHTLEVWEHPRPAENAREPDPSRPAPLTAASPAHLLELEAARVAEEDQLLAQEPAGAGAYVVGVDVAKGEVNTFSQGDFHVVKVFDHHSHDEVAVHESRMDIHELPLWVLLIALYYNTALLAVEVNDAGIAVVDPLTKDYRYRRMFRRKRLDRIRNIDEDKPGWETNSVTKPAMESTFGGALQDGTHGTRDLQTARQLTTYVIDERGRHGALEGEYDDRLMATMIAHQVMELVRAPRRNKRRPRREPSDPLTGY
jgi:hypothetical protein